MGCVVGCVVRCVVLRLYRIISEVIGRPDPRELTAYDSKYKELIFAGMMPFRPVECAELDDLPRGEFVHVSGGGEFLVLAEPRFRLYQEYAQADANEIVDAQILRHFDI